MATIADDDGATETAYPLTLASPHGSTVLEQRPTRVVALTTVDLDIAVALGVLPIAATGGEDPGQAEPYIRESVASLEAETGQHAEASLLQTADFRVLTWAR